MKNEKIARIIAVAMCALALILVIGIGVGAMNTISNVATGGTGGACAHKNLKRSPQNEPLNHVNHLVLVECATCGQDTQNVYEAHDYYTEGDTACQVCGHVCVHRYDASQYIKCNDGTHSVYTICTYCDRPKDFESTVEACIFDENSGTCEKCGFICSHAQVADNGTTAVCNICGLDLKSSYINITNGAGGDFYYIDGMTWSDVLTCRYEIKTMEGQFFFQIALDGVTVDTASGAYGFVALDGIAVKPEDMLIPGVTYTMIE